MKFFRESRAAAASPRQKESPAEAGLSLEWAGDAPRRVPDRSEVDVDGGATVQGLLPPVAGLHRQVGLALPVHRQNRLVDARAHQSVGNRLRPAFRQTQVVLG